MSVLLIVIALVLFVGAIVAYVGGVKKEKAWGQPLLILCVVGLVAVALVRVFGGAGGAGGTPGRVAETGAEKLATEEVAALAPALEGAIESEDTILVIHEAIFVPGQDITYRTIKGVRKAVKDQLEKALGVKGLNTDYMSSGQAGDVASAISQGAKPEHAAIVSMVGVSGSIESAMAGREVPLVAVLPKGYDVDTVRSLLNAGALQGAAAKKGEAYVLYTKENLP
jgi:hypothetical protein